MEIKRFIGGILEANGYVVTDGRSGLCWVIDPGYQPKRFTQYLRKENLRAKAILLTHHHGDHSGAAEQLRRETGCELIIHRSDADAYGGDVDVYLEGGETLTCGELTCKVIHTPGHTRGGCCFCIPKYRVCFTGDTVFNVDLGRTDLEDGSIEEMERSIRQVVDAWPNDVRIYPGHGDDCTMKTVRKINQEFLNIVEEGK